MPIEIRELVIKATVAAESGPGTSPSSAATNNAVSPPEEIINTCVEKILDILKDKMER